MQTTGIMFAQHLILKSLRINSIIIMPISQAGNWGCNSQSDSCTGCVRAGTQTLVSKFQISFIRSPFTNRKDQMWNTHRGPLRPARSTPSQHQPFKKSTASCPQRVTSKHKSRCQFNVFTWNKANAAFTKFTLNLSVLKIYPIKLCSIRVIFWK